MLPQADESGDRLPRDFHGYRLLRLLSARPRSAVYLGCDGAERLGAMKVHGPLPAETLADLRTRLTGLRDLSRAPGLLPILAIGTADEGTLWEWLPLADGLDGLSFRSPDADPAQYNPLTLRAAITLQGSASAEQTARWGVGLAQGLATLHAAGWVHRDVKPGNIFFVEREPVLADYGLTGRSWGTPQFSGTEGYRPLEGTSEIGTDLFALGKTLYEAWTGLDRLEFPSLPRAVLEARDWRLRGNLLNASLLRACDPQAGRRYQSASEFAYALQKVIDGESGTDRRRWLQLGAAAIVSGVAFLTWKSRHRPVPRLVWRRVRERGFNVEAWWSHAGTADWTRRKLYSFKMEPTGHIFQSLTLDGYALTGKRLENGPKELCSASLHPETRDIWLIEGGLGEVFTFNPDTEELRSLGGGPSDGRHFFAHAYWNPFTRRMGVFGGYGHLAVTNSRHEFDTDKARWVMIEPDRDGPGPCRRDSFIPFTADPTGRKLYLGGPYGSLLGRQGEMTSGWPAFDGRFHHLDDIWELDLLAQKWRQILPFGHFAPQRMRVLTYMPELGGLVVLEGMTLTDPPSRSVQAWLVRTDRDPTPIRLQCEGKLSRLAEARGWVRDPRNGELILLADDGIYRISAEAPMPKLA